MSVIGNYIESVGDVVTLKQGGNFPCEGIKTLLITFFKFIIMGIEEFCCFIV